jgi:hypothetical protein
VNVAIGVYFAPPAVSADQYNEAVKRLKKAGAGHPTGRSYHTAFGASDKLMVFEVWTSQAAFERFGKTLMPILQDVGIDPGQPAVMPIHKVITPAAATRAAKKRPAARRLRKPLGRKKR